MSSTWFFAAFSAALVVSALAGPRAGRTVDAVGGREVLAVSNVISVLDQGYGHCAREERRMHQAGGDGAQRDHADEVGEKTESGED